MEIINGTRVPTVTPTGIYGFFEQYRFLSNFYPCPVTVDGIEYPSSEHAYMAQKTLDPSIRAKIVTQPSPAKAKIFGNTIVLRDNWDSYRLPAMLLVLTAKFENPVLRARLLRTEDLYLEETNNWKDRYWGVDEVGSNYLGKLLMLLRSNYQLQEREAAKQEPIQPPLF